MTHLPIYARRVILWASLIGLFASTYLLIAYVSGAPIVCGTTHGCELVRASKWAYTFGLPRPLFGVIFYVGIICLLAIRAILPHWRTRWVYRLTMLAAGIGFVESAFLFFVQWLDIRAFCVWCLTSAAMATLIAIAAFFDRPTPLEDKTVLREIQFIFWSFVAAVIVGAVLIFFMIAPHTDGEPEQIRPVAQQEV